MSIITKKMLLNLQNSLNGAGKTVERNHEGNQRLTFGNLWFGDYWALGANGSFGTQGKNCHWGVITDRRRKKKASRRITPITSKETKPKDALILEKGVIESSQKCKSYIITSLQNRLLIRVSTLEYKFQYSGKLPEVYQQELKMRIHAK